MEISFQKDLFSSVVSNIKSYNGNDPLRPWIQGIRRIHQSLPTHVLKEKLPRFLQKCAQTFESDQRYQNDSRYLAVWFQLMGFVEDAKVLLKKMENKQIGVKRAKFYITYALYYEKKKKFQDAEKMYQLAVHNLAEPIEELQKSYDQFQHRMKLRRHRRARVESMPNTSGRTPAGVTISTKYIPRDSSQKPSDLKNCPHAENIFKSDHPEKNSCFAQSPAIPTEDLDRPAPFSKDDGLLDSAINKKEAMNTISSMFKVVREPETITKSLNQAKPKSYENQCSIEVLADEEIEESRDGNYSIADTRTSGSRKITGNTQMQKPFVGPFMILADDEDDDCDESNDDCDVDVNDDDDDDDDGDDDEEDAQGEIEEQVDGSCDHTSLKQSCTGTGYKSYDTRLNEDTVIRRLKEDTVIRKFVGSTVFDDPKVENACHHGLVDPTVNLKQAMDDINGMFGKTLNFVKARKPKKQEKQFDRKPDSSNHTFFILADDDIEQDAEHEVPACISCSSNGESSFFEPTIFTKEAMNEINELFGKPLDF